MPNIEIEPSNVSAAYAHSFPGKILGEVVGVRQPLILAKMPIPMLGSICTIEIDRGIEVEAQVVGFDNNVVSLAPLNEIQGLYPGAKVYGSNNRLRTFVSSALIGNTLDALGNPISTKLGHEEGEWRSLRAPAPPAFSRIGINKMMQTSIGAIDGLASLAYGQRVALLSAAGLGKSTLLGLLARRSAIDLCVVALVGERGREINEFIQDCLGAEGLQRSILVVATSDESAFRRQLAVYTATTIAEYFRDQGKRVLLLVDSLTRVARAMRDVALACGEIPLRHGLTSSIYSELPKIFERAGNNDKGSITAIYSLLTEDDSTSDPLAEEVKSLLDGHIVLTNRMLKLGIRPAIDPCRSLSRVNSRLHSQAFLKCQDTINRILLLLQDDKELVSLGGEPSVELRAALTLEDEIYPLLKDQADVSALARKLESLAAQFLKLTTVSH